MNHRNIFYLTGFILLLSYPAVCQLVISSDTSALTDPSAVLEVRSGVKGLKIPSMTKAQRLAIPSPATGLLIFQSETPSGFYFYSGNNWTLLGMEEGASSHAEDTDGNKYRTIKIGNQEWMAENLRVTHYRNGDAIPNVTDNTSWTSLSTGAYCWYQNNSSYSAVYGALYNWFALSDTRGICPSGWHVSSNSDFWTLINYLGGVAGFAGSKMMAASPDNVYYGYNSSGFSGRAAGQRNYSNGSFTLMGQDAFWATPELNYDNKVFTYNFVGSYSGIYMAYPPKSTGLSVRCVRD